MAPATTAAKSATAAASPTPAAVPAPLSRGDEARYARDGYLVLPAAFSAAEVDAMRADADFILELVVNSSLANGRHSGRLDMRRQGDGTAVARKIQPVADLGLNLARFAADQRLLGPMAALMGDKPVLMEDKLNYKQPLLGLGDSEMATFRTPKDDDRFPVHNDWAYFKHNRYPPAVISSAIAIDGCGEHNGTIRVFPGSHKRHIEHLRVRNGLEVPPGSVDAAAAVPIVAPAGSVMFFHSRLIHTSGPNTSGAARRMMIFSHVPEAAGIGFDIRNGPIRLRESPWEWRYQRLRDAGEHVDSFRANGQSRPAIPGPAAAQP